MDVRNNQMFSRHEWEQLVSELALSPRQAQVAECVLGGLSDKQIAQRLGIRVPTIRTYLARLFENLHAADRIELVLQIVRHFRKKCDPKCCPHCK
jgi:DNA-binding NarL/FixJ family response regulator